MRIFSRVEIALDSRYDEGKVFSVIAHNNSPENVYVQQVSLNGKELKRPYILHNEIVNGGELVFEMGKEPNKVLYAM